MKRGQESTTARYFSLNNRVAVRVPDARCQELGESRERWCGPLSTGVMNTIRAYDLTFEQAAAMQDAELLRLPGSVQRVSANFVGVAVAIAR